MIGRAKFALVTLNIIIGLNGLSNLCLAAIMITIRQKALPIENLVHHFEKDGTSMLNVRLVKNSHLPPASGML